MGLLDHYQSFVGWRYLFRRRASRSVRIATAALGVEAIVLALLFLLVQWPAGSILPGVLAFFLGQALLFFTVVVFLNFFSVFTAISMGGVAFGVAALVVTMSVTSGFQEAFQNKVLGVNGHVIVLKYGLDFSKYNEVVKTVEGVPHVRAAAPFVFNEMMIAHGPALSGVLVKGIVPGQSERVLDVDRQMIAGSVRSLMRGNAAGEGGPPLPAIVVGKELARKLKVKLGDVVRVISPLGSLDPSLWSPDEKSPKMREFRVGGIFYSGFDEYDRRLVYLNLPEAQAFLEGGDVVTGVEMVIDDIYSARKVAGSVEKALDGAPYRVMDWRELNHNLFTALELQKLVLSIVLFIIVVVACFGIVATLTMLVIDKTREIAILKSLGMPSSGAAAVFQTAGMTIGVLGTCAGLLLGVAICAVVSRYGYHLDPRVYLIDELPVHVRPYELVWVSVVTLGICFLATIYPSVRAASVPPVEGLRYE